MIPLLVARLSGEEDVGDLEFIQDKVVAGDYFQKSGNINTIGSTIEFTVPDTRTAFMIEAKITITGHPDTASAFENTGNEIIQKNAVQAEFKIDTVVKDTANVGEVTGSGATSTRWGYGNGYSLKSDSFNVLGLSLLGVGTTKKIEIVNTVDDGNAFATMSGYLL